MKIVVYCASTMGNDEKYAKITEKLGMWIGLNHHTLVYGGGKSGLMGVVADAVLQTGGEVIGVLPDNKEILSRKHPSLSTYYYVKNLAQRKEKMIDLADAFIALPGGPGTLDEISDVIALHRVHEIEKPIVLYDVDGFYQTLKQFYKEMKEKVFLNTSDIDCVLFSENLEEICKFITK